MSWPTIPAAELMLKRGGSVNPANYPDETFELLSIPAFDKGEPEIVEGKAIGSSKSCVQPNDVLLSKIVPHIKRCWVVPAPTGAYRQIGSGEWIIFRSDKIHPPFLRHFLTSEIFHKQFMNTTAGVGGSLVRARPAEVGNIEIPLPPLPEQKRIAAVLDKADAIRRKRQQAIQLADDFLRAVFLDMFGDPVTNPKGWDVRAVKEMAKVTTGNTPPRDKTEYYGDFIEWIKSDNINTPSDFLTVATEYLSEAGCIVGRRVPAGSTLLTCIAGSFDCIGNAAYADREVSFNQQINALTPMPGVNGIFLYALSKYCKKAIQAASTGGMKGMVSKGKLEEVRFICPPESMQQKFAEAFHRYQDLRQGMEHSQDGLSDEFSSISQKAFSGQL